MKTRRTPYIWIAPFVSLGIMLVLFAFAGIFPFGTSTTAISDGVSQYIPFLAEFADKIKTGGSLLFTWHAGRGVNFWSNFAYYLASPLNLISLFFKQGEADKAFAIISLVRIPLMALTFGIFLKHCYKKNDLSIVIFSLLWAFSGFIIEIMAFSAWFDSIIYLPIVILGLQRLMDGKSGLLYSGFLALSIASNFYIGWMICIFCVMYFVYSLISDENIVYESAKSEKDKTESNETAEDSINILEFFKNSYLLSTMFKFAACSLIAGISTAVIALPTVYSLGMTYKGNIATDSKINITDFWGVLASHTFPVKNMYATMTSLDVLFCFCGIVTLILVIAYFFSKGISVRKKIGNLFLLVCLWISFVFFKPYFVWHAFGTPVGVMYRFVFIYSFVLLKIAFEAFMDIEKLRTVGLVLGTAAVTVCALGLKLSGRMMKYFYSPKLIAAVIVIALVYFVILMLLSKKLKLKTVLTVILLLCVIGETSFMYKGNIQTSDLKDNMSEKSAVEQVKPVLTDGDILTFNPKKQSFGDMIMYGFDFGFNAMEYYSSMAVYDTTLTIKNMGVNGNGLNAQNGAVGQTPVFNMIFPTKYTLDGKGEYSENWFRHKLSEKDGYTLYENNYTLPFMYTVPTSVLNWKPFSYPIPIDMQNASAKVFTGTESNILTYNSASNFVFENCKSKRLLDYFKDYASMQNIVITDENEKYYNYLENKMFGIACEITDKTKDAYISFTSTAEDDGIQYIFVDTNMFTEMYITVGGIEKEYNVYGVNENRTYEIGEVKKGDKIEVKIGGHKESSEDDKELTYNYGDESISAVCFTVNKDKFEKAYNVLDSMSDTEILEFKDTYVKAKVNSYKDGILYIPVADDGSWKITIDGNEVPLYEHESHILMTEITKGEHIVEMKYCPQGFVAGAVITGICIAIFIAWAVILKKRNDKLTVSDIIEKNADKE